MTREEQTRQWHRRHRKGSVPTLVGTARAGAVGCGSYGGCVPHPIVAGLWLLFAAILVSPLLDGATRTTGVGFGVLAAPCMTGNTTAGGPTTVSVDVNPTTGVNLTMFNCEGGDFEVFWSGVVNVTDTIYIGLGTTVNIMGDTSHTITSDTTSMIEASSSIHSTGHEGVDDVIAMLSIPRGLASAAVRVAPSNTSAAANESIALGPVFYVDGGELLLENMAIRGGAVTNSTEYPTASGAGIHAQHSNVTATWCEFEDNFAEFQGGGVFAHASTLIVISSVFRRCRAGFQAEAGDEGLSSAGGGISSNATDTFIFGCLFEDCYANKKGGGMHQGWGGKMSVLQSGFYNNSAGSNSAKDEAEVGEAGALSISTCELSFDSQGGCSVNDTVFAFNHVARKGGAVNVATGQWASNVEFHRCTLTNTTTGAYIEDDPQGEGGVLNASPGNRVLLADSHFEDNYCGNKGGVISLSSGEGWEDDPGSTVILRNSTFKSNTAEAGNAGVVSLGEFTSLVVAGDGNVFRGNTCGDDGGVFGGTTNTNITVEGGVFRDNLADEGGGVVWTKGKLEVQGGTFLNNKAKGIGGVIYSADGSTTLLTGGEFEGNKASDGGVVYAGSGSQLSVSSGEFLDNEASNRGGAFFVDGDGMLKITGGLFSENEADFGGFLYKEGKGNVSCVGALIEKSEGVDGGAIYAVDGAVLNWACDLKENTALAGPAIYARGETTVILLGVSLVDNVVARGSVVFVVDESHLETYQVEFKDTTKSSDISAVQVDEKSSYQAEDTSFVGFQGEAVVFSKGTLYLDDCDFSGSTASQLVYTEPGSIAVIRNTVLGDNNYLSLAKASSLAVKLPTADSLTNANVTCQDEVNGGDSSSSDSSDPHPICFERSPCLEGDLGVYCRCYLQRSTMEKRCVNRDAAGLHLKRRTEPIETFFPDMLEGDLVLSHKTSVGISGMPSTSDTGIISRSSAGGGDVERRTDIVHDGSQSGVIWIVSAMPQLSESGASMMNWTIFPSSGLLLPGKSVTMRVVTLPSSGFDGKTSATFNARGMASIVPPSSVSFAVTFFHCEIGEVWSGTSSSLDGSDEDPTDACKLCGDVVGGETRGVECDEPGATVTALPVDPGYWRASLDTTFIRECSNEDACKGGANVANVEEYCNDGYQGPECSVCAPDYGRGAGNQCHRCTPSFRAGMLSILALVAVFVLVVTALLVVYLIGGRGAVSSTVASTKESVRTIQRRGSGLFPRSEGAGVSDFSIHFGLNSTKSGDIPGDGIELARGMKQRKSSVRGNGSGSISHSIPETNPVSSRNLEGGSGRPIIAARLLSTKTSNFSGRAAPVRPNSPMTKQGGRAVMTPAKTRGSRSSSTSHEHKSPETARDASSHGDRAGVYGSAGHRHVNSSGVPGQTWMSELEREYGRPLATRVILEGSSGNTWQPQPSRERGDRRSENGSDVEGPERNGAQPQSRESDRAAKVDGDNTAAGRIGNMLMELPLSKLKIVIVVWQISAAFSNITSVGYPPIYEKFLSIIGIFSLDLAWIISAACLTTEVNFYDKLLMVTIGPLVVLGLLGVTFHIGARPVSPVATDLPTISQAHSISESGTNVHQMSESVGTDLAVQREKKSNSSSSQDSSQVLELPRLGPVLQRGRPSGGSGETMTMSRSERPPTGVVTLIGQRQSSGLDRVSLDGTTVNPHDSSTEQIRSVAGSSASQASEYISLGKTQPAQGSGLETGTGNEADPEKDRLGGLFARHTTMTLILLYLIYSQVSTVVFQTFSCEGFPEISKSYLRADQSIECYTREHRGYRIYAAVMIFLYPLGIPAAFFFLLSRQGSSINPPTDKVVKELRGTQHVVREKIKQRSTDRSIAPTSFLWNAYYPNRYYYEVFECLRRLVLTGLLVFLVPDTPGQVAFSCVFAFASLLAFELQRPHIDSLEVQLYRTGCLVIFFTNFLALMIKAEVADENSAGSAIYSVVLIMVNVMFFLSIWWNSWAAIKLTFSRRGFQGAMMGIDVVGEDTVDTLLGPNKKERVNASLGDGGDVNSSPEEERPAWDNTSV